MTTPRANPPGPDEMIEAWRKQASEMEGRWNDYLNQMMGTDAFAQTMARSMDGYLSLQSSLAKGMEQYLRALNIPTRTDIMALTERISQLEEKIEALTSAVDTAEPAQSRERAPARPAETRARRNSRSRATAATEQPAPAD